MNQPQSLKLAIAVMALLLAAHSDASAQATRTWVSGVGDDVNPCSRTAPCKTFAGAISKTATGGEINCIDAGGFGAVTITKSITIDGGESFASILAGGSNGIIVNAPAGSVVTIRNLSINGAGNTPGVNGIRFLGGETLHVENCVIFGFNQNGILVEPAPAATQTFNVFVLDTVIRNCATVANTGGILLKPGLNGTVNASLDGVKLNQNKGTGLRAEVRSNATIRNSVISGNTSNGVLALAAGAPGAAVAIENCVVSGNNPGIQSNGAQATIRCSNASIFNSGAFGGILAAGGRYVTFLNNRIDNTAGNDFPAGGLTTTIPQK